jgi:hypothetical protein
MPAGLRCDAVTLIGPGAVPVMVQPALKLVVVSPVLGVKYKDILGGCSGALTVNLLLALALPPGPVTVTLSWKVVGEYWVPLLYEPLGAPKALGLRVPVLLVALVLVQVNVDNCPVVIGFGLQLADTVGAGGGGGSTVTDALVEVLPPGPSTEISDV